MARWLFLILLVLNILLFTWGYQRPQPQVKPLAPLPEGAPTILLLAEQDAQKSDHEPEPLIKESAEDGEGEGLNRQTPAWPSDGSIQIESLAVRQDDIVQGATEATGRSEGEPDTAGAAGRDKEEPEQEEGKKCIRLGPIAQRAAATILISELSGLGHDAALQVEVEQRENGFWVLIPASSEDPDFVIANLELAGIQDLWQFTKGELDGAVSLGLYSDRQQARERLQELADKGFDATVQPRSVEVSTFWVRALLATDDSDADMELVYNKFPWLGFPPLECVEIATP